MSDMLSPVVMLRANKMSAVVAHKLSGFHTIPRRYRYETGRMVTGDSEDEIRRSIMVVGRAGRLTQDEAARLLGVCERNSGAILIGMKMKA